MLVTDAGPPEDRSFLRAARERRGLSLVEIASTTKISVSALEALERYDPSNLPGGIFTRAFVRSYAVEVGLDPEAAVTEFLDRCPAEDPVQSFGPVASESPGHFGREGRIPAVAFRVALLAVPIVALLVFLGVRACDDRAVTVPAASAASAPRSASPAVASESPPPTAPAPPVEVPPLTPAEVPPLTMDIRPIRDCWVSATVDGEVVLSRLMQAGESEVFTAEEAITVNVGDAGAFVYTLNEEPGRLLGERGQVATETITPANYRSYVAR
jgi:cytoskeleton protein RodZ